MKYKGDFKGICNRTACDTNLKALWYNSSTQKYYCEKCAERINFWSMRDHGVILCTKKETK